MQGPCSRHLAHSPPPCLVPCRGLVATVCPGVWGAVVNFERVGRKGGSHANDSDDDVEDGLGPEADNGGAKKHKKRKKHDRDAGAG